jgi:hypothetical protein
MKNHGPLEAAGHNHVGVKEARDLRRPPHKSYRTSRRNKGIPETIRLLALSAIVSLGLIPPIAFAQNEKGCSASVFANPYSLPRGSAPAGLEAWWGDLKTTKADSSPEAAVQASLQAQVARMGSQSMCYADGNYVASPYGLTLQSIDFLEPIKWVTMGGTVANIPVNVVAAANVAEHSCGTTFTHRLAVLWADCGARRYERASCPLGNPIFPGTGTKVQSELRYVSDSAGELSLVDTYRSNWGGPPRAGLGSHWTHNWARVLNIAYASSAQASTVVAIRRRW